MLTLTYVERAERLYHAYGRMDATGRIYLKGEYVGRIDTERGYARSKGLDRGLILLTTDPVQVVARWLMR